MTTHPPPEEMLAAYATGAATPGIALLVASHLTYAPESRRKVAAFEALGGALLAEEKPADLPGSSLDRALAALDEPAASRDPVAARPNGPLPRPVMDAVGKPFEEIRWSFRLPGVSESDIGEFDGEKVSLLRARPGAAIPQHTHEGTELTLVLAGMLEDSGAVFGPGDLAVNTDEHDHKPQILGDKTCYCLVVMDGRMRFTGRFMRALNFLAE